MARIYVSSTKADLEAERAAVLDWIARRHDEPVHSYVANTDTVRDSCLADVATCDAYVLLIASRYGTTAAEPNPEGRSITELEYEAALRKPGMRIVVLLVEYVSDPRLTDLRNKAVYGKLLDFRERVGAAHRPAQIDTLAELIPALEAALAAAVPRDPLADPEVQKIITRLTAQSVHKDERIEALTHENSELKAQLAAAISRTLGAAAAPGATAAQVGAAAAMRAGDTAPAQALLRGEEQAATDAALASDNPEAERAARRRAAGLARERGALAMQTDVAAAMEAFQEAAAHDPTDAWNGFFLGDMHVAVGDLAAAQAAYLAVHDQVAARAAAKPQSDDAARDLAASYNRIGAVRVAQGDLPSALSAFEADLAIAERLAARDPANTQWQRDLSVSHNKIGDVRVAQGDLPAALSTFEASLAIAERLAARDPANTEWQRDLSVSHNRIGAVRVAQGDLPAALSAFKASLAIAERLAARDPANTEWQRDLSVSHDRFGDVRAAQGDLPAALSAFEASLAIRERLAARDPANTEWQRDLSVSHDRIGDVRVKHGDLPAALSAFEASLAIRERLATRDPANAQWRIDVAVSCSRFGTLPDLSSDTRLAHLRRGLGILDELAAAGRLPPNQDSRDWFKKRLKG